MLSLIIEKENDLDALLPKKRMEKSPPAELLAAAQNWSHTVWAEAEKQGPMPLDAGQITNGLRLALQPVFICGVHRSGTTLVRNILDGHPELVVLPSEGTYYTNLEYKLYGLPEHERAAFLGTEWLRRLANPINQPPYWVLGRSSGSKSSYMDFARYLMAWWPVIGQTQNAQWPHMAVVLAYASCTGNLNARLYVDKTPTNERFLTRIWQETPAAKIIHVIRDPLATLTSRKKMEPSVIMRRALLDLKISFRIAVDKLNLDDPAYLLVRYEDVCENPRKVTRRIATFVGIQPSAKLNQPTVAGIPAPANSFFARETGAGRILKKNEHPHGEVLSLAKQQLLASCIGSMAGKLNYTLVKIGAWRKLVLIIKYRLL